MLNKFTSSLLVAAVSAHKCPDMHQYRTDAVLNGFDDTKMSGKWFEVAYEDVAQVGAEC